jgi:hypothetical protein
MPIIVLFIIVFLEHYSKSTSSWSWLGPDQEMSLLPGMAINSIAIPGFHQFLHLNVDHPEFSDAIA